MTLRGDPVPPDEARKLKQLTRSIQAGMAAESERGNLMVKLHQRGFQFSTIASAAGIHPEMARKAVLRRTTGWAPDKAREA